MAPKQADKSKAKPKAKADAPKKSGSGLGCCLLFLAVFGCAVAAAVHVPAVTEQLLPVLEKLLDVADGWDFAQKHLVKADKWLMAEAIPGAPDMCLEGNCTEGWGTATFKDGRRYEGEWKNSFVGPLKDGIGIYEWPDGQSYAGTYKNNVKHGSGVSVFKDGSRFEGQFDGDEWAGFGVATWPDGKKYEGGFQGGKKSGSGVNTWPDGQRYEGEFMDDIRHGFGVYTRSDGSRYEGEYQKGERKGTGVLTLASGQSQEIDWSEETAAKVRAAAAQGVLSAVQAREAAGVALETVKRANKAVRWARTKQAMQDPASLLKDLFSR